MRIPFFGKKTAKNPVQPRNPDGTFGSPVPTQLRQETAIKSAINEFSFLGNAAQALQEINKLAQIQDNAVQERAEALAMDSQEGVSIGNEWIPVIQQILPYVAPYLPGLIQKYTGVNPSPQESPLPNSPASEPKPAEDSDLITWITRASKASPKLIKPVIPTLEANLIERGIDPSEFKQAIINISRAYGEKA